MIFKPEDYAPEELFQLNKRKYSIFYRQTSEDYTDFVIQQGSTPSGNDYLSMNLLSVLKMNPEMIMVSFHWSQNGSHNPF